MSIIARHVLCLPLDTMVRTKLICCGFKTTEDLTCLSVNEIKAATSLNNEEANHVLTVVGPYINSEARKHVGGRSEVPVAQVSDMSVIMKPVAHLLRSRLKQVQHVVCFSSEVDRLLSGGFPLGKITEIAGGAGVGKTQFCFQLCVDVQIPKCLGGVGGEAVFLDAEGTFVPGRVAQIARSTVDHCHQVESSGFSLSGLKGRDEVKQLSVEKMLSCIYLIRCQNSVQLLGASYQLKEFLKAHAKVRLLVIDSVAQCVRGDNDFHSRARFLCTLGRIYRCLAEEFGVAVVLANQITTKISNDGPSFEMAALGAKWSHLSSVKLMLYKCGKERYVQLYKSLDKPDGIVAYAVTTEGIRDAIIRTECQTQDICGKAGMS